MRLKKLGSIAAFAAFFVFTFLLQAGVSFSAGTVTKGLIGKEDLKQWNGTPGDATFNRTTSSGYSLTMHSIGDAVDVLQVYGGGVTRTGATIASAMSTIGTTNKATLVLAPGATWTLTANLTITSNLTLVIPPGTSITTGSFTLTINGPFSAERYQVFDTSGGGSVVFGAGAVAEVFPEWWAVNTTPGTTDMASALNAAIVTGIPVRTQQITYGVASTVTMATAGSKLLGPGTIKATSTFTDTAVVTISANNVQIKDGITIDGAAAALYGSGVWLNGIKSSVATYGVHIDCTVQNCGFDGINFEDAGGTISHQNTYIGGKVINVGWCGLELSGLLSSEVRMQTVYRTGYHGISFASRAQNVRLSGYVNKAVAPTVIYNGAGGFGGVEKGAFLYLDTDTNNVTVTDFVGWDNRNAADDGIMLGEDGTDNRYNNVFSNVRIYLAGGFGIDVSSGMTLTNFLIDGAVGTGLFCGLDLGGTIQNVVVADGIIRNVGYSVDGFGIRFATTAPNTIRFKNINIHNVIVSDIRATPHIATGVGFDTTGATFTNVIIADCDLSNVKTFSFYTYGIGTDPIGIRTQRNVVKTFYLTTTGSYFSAVGYDEFHINQAGAASLNYITDGYLGQVIYIRFTDSNTTVNFDWSGTGGWGVDSLVGNSNTDWNAQGGDMLRCVKLANCWYCDKIISH